MNQKEYSESLKKIVFSTLWKVILEQLLDYGLIILDNHCVICGQKINNGLNGFLIHLELKHKLNEVGKD